MAAGSKEATRIEFCELVNDLPTETLLVECKAWRTAWDVASDVGQHLERRGAASVSWGRARVQCDWRRVRTVGADASVLV